MSRATRLACLLCAPLAVAIGCGAQAPGGTQDQALADRIEQQAARYRETTVTATTSPRPAPERTTASDAPAGASASAGARPLLSPADRTSFARTAAALPGAEGVAVSELGRGRPVFVVGSQRRGVAWSTAKVPVAMAAISRGTASSADLTRAITASDNAAAESLWSGLGGGAGAAARATAQLRAAGDTRTRIQAQRLRAGYTAFGQTDWRLADQTRFVAGMSCTRSGRQVLTLMGRVIPAQRWGLGRVDPEARLKGGWGPGVSPGVGDGWLDRQMGIVSVRGVPLAVTLASTAPGHGGGTAALDRLARWLVAHVDVRGAAARADC